MASLLQKLPTILVLCALLGIFFSLRKHAKSGSTQLWSAAWALILLHFIAQVFEAGALWRQEISTAVDLSALQLSGIVFIAATSDVLLRDRRALAFFCGLLGVPVVVHATMVSWSLDYRWAYTACLAMIFLGGPLIWYRISRSWAPADWIVSAIAVVCGIWSIQDALRHSYEFGTLATLTLVFAAPGVAFYRTYKRWSRGVVCTIVGFLCWGAVFPIASLASHFFPGTDINPELWNVPKFFVAFGMILAMVEDKSASLEAANGREREASEQMARFAHITSQLLSGSDRKQMAEQSAATITQFSNFRRAAITFCDDEGNLCLAGHSGLDQKAEREFRAQVPHWKGEHIAELCSIGTPLSANSYYLKYEQLAKFSPVRSEVQFARNPHWENGDEIFIPLRSPTGRYMGAISLDDPKDVQRVNAAELSKIELLAADLAVSLENSTLQRQLVQSEKLAAVGKLVSGVAHELNNPLTAIAGYAELLLDDVTEPSRRQKLESIAQESKRMHTIIDNLLRFARRKTIGQAPLDLQTVLRDALSLYSYRIRSDNVAIETHVDQNLPRVLGDEDQMKQVFVNLLGNAIEAVRDSSVHRVTVEITALGDKVVTRFSDTGPGFADLNRAFDPFYTTKAVGKGTGLGLSICYGLVKEHGGDIYAENLEPTGAAVVIRLPKAEQKSQDQAMAAATFQSQ